MPKTHPLFHLSQNDINRILAYFRSADGAFSPNTLKAMQSDLVRFTAWCTKQDKNALPASASTLAKWVGDVSRENRPATVRRQLSSIRHIHRALNEPDATTDGEVTLALKRMDRRYGVRQKQAQALTNDDVQTILSMMRKSTIDLRDTALLLCGRDLLARREELVSLKFDDLIWNHDGSASISICCSKTDQTKIGADLWLSLQATSALKSWIDAANIEGGHLFRAVRKNGNVGGPLSADDVARRFKAMAERAGIDPTNISGHSARVGMAQDLCANGAELAEMMVAGRWQSPRMPAHYSARLKAARGAVAKYHSMKTDQGV